MGFRFRKTISIMPGVKLNIGKTGITTSIGPKGATLNIGRRGRKRVTIGVPGTGLSYSDQLPETSTHRRTGSGGTWLLFACLLLGLLYMAL